MTPPSRAPWRWPGGLAIGAVLAGMLTLLPLAGVLVAASGEQSGLIAWRDIARYAATSAVVTLGVAMLAAMIGTGAAWLTVAYDFPGRRWLTWALALPLAAPAFAIAYAYADLFDVAGPVQSGLRGAGWDGGVAVRSVPGAILILALAFYPYVYLAMRAAFLTQSAGAIDAARLLGAGAWARFWRIALPMARPALAAGVALTAMETLADYGAVAFLSVQTLTTGIVRAWSSFGAPASAARLALPLLATAALLLWIERASRRGAGHGGARGGWHRLTATPLAGVRGWLAFALCFLPLLLGLLLPAGWLVWTAVGTDPRWGDIALALGNSMMLAALAVALIVPLALLIALGGRGMPLAVRATSLGYATPGAVMAIGLLAPASLLWQGGWMTTGLFAGIALLLLAYAARLMAAAVEPIEAGLARLPPGLAASARVLGRSEARAAWHIEIPLLRPAMGTAALLLFVDIVKELPATLILRPFDFDTLAVMASTYALDERLGQAAVPALIIIAAAIVPVIILSRRIAAPLAAGR